MGGLPSKRRRGSALLSSEEGSSPVPQDECVTSGRGVVVSLYDYPTRGPNDAAIRLGERLNILSDEGEWWRVSSSATGTISYLPSNYTARVYSRWQFVGVGKQKAEELLLLPHNQAGSFLIRASETHPGSYTLSLRRSSGQEQASIRHYRIHRLDNGWVFISPRLTFRGLSELVAHYSDVSDGLCCTLGEPCYIMGYNSVPVVTGVAPVGVRRPSLNWKDMRRSMILGRSQGTAQDPPLSEGLKDAISSYLFMTEGGDQLQDWDT